MDVLELCVTKKFGQQAKFYHSQASKAYRYFNNNY